MHVLPLPGPDAYEKVRVWKRTFANLRLRRLYCAAADLVLSTKWQNEALTIPVSYEELPDISFFLILKIQTWL